MVKPLCIQLHTVELQNRAHRVLIAPLLSAVLTLALHARNQQSEDFNRGENLPVIIFANWRGFSGGTRDMYNEAWPVRQVVQRNLQDVGS